LSGPPTDDPGIVRELRRQLLGRLQILRHEKFGTLENLERLIWYLSAVQDSDPSDESSQVRIRSLVADTQNSTLARLRDIAALSRRVGIREARIAALEQECQELSGMLEQIAEAPDIRAANPGLAALTELGAALKRESRLIRAEAESFFSADALAILAEVLRAQSGELAAADVDVVVGGEMIGPETWQPSPAGLAVIADRDDLAFVLDNLVGNAIRAMAAMPQRHLAISWERTELRAYVRVADTGCGIPPDDWDRVLAGESRPGDGSGLGFKQTREFLKLYHAEMWIESSQPGKGTTFALSLRIPVDS
jgi:signal transduction histidine kinase